MRVHNLSVGNVWGGISKTARGVPPGWVACEVDPLPGQIWTGAGWGAAVANLVAPPTPVSRDSAKAERQAAVEAIKVTTAAGNTFDGDETSQTRMARAIIALQATSTPTVTWVLADNTVIEASAAELTEALALAGAAQAALWVIE